MLALGIAIIRRLLIVIPVLWAVVTLVFLLIHIVPGDPARNLVGENATEQQVQQVRSELGLDKPLITQYADYWRGLLRGAWGVKPVTHEPVLKRNASRYPPTVKLAITAMIFAIIASGPLLGPATT